MKICLAILVSLFAATSAFAQHSDVITGSTNANLVLAQNSADDYKATFNVAAGYDHIFLENGFSIGADLGGSFGDNYDVFTVLVGPGYNFNKEDIANSYNADVKIGFVRSNFNNNTDTEFAAALQVGKRFKLADSVSYAPGVEISKIFADNAQDPTFTFNIFKFAFLF